MTLDLEHLPDDPALLHQMLRDLLGTLAERERRIEQLEHQLAQLCRHQFGRRSEKIDSARLMLAFAQFLKDAGVSPPPRPQQETRKKGHGRKRDGPVRFLGDYKGYLGADAFGGYDGIYAGGQVIEVACWAHARRKFYDARASDRERAHAALAFIG